jgi:DNA-binding beta-propeller fold protein YncE
MRAGPLLATTLVVLVCCGLAGASSSPVPVEAAVVQTGRGPCGAVASGGAVWVGVYDTGTVLRIDAGDRVAKRIRVGRWACRLALDPHAIWVTRDRAGVLVRIDRATGRRRSIFVGRSPFDVLLTKRSLWATSYDIGTIATVDARAGRSTRLYKDGGYPAGLALCGGRVWVGHGRDVTWLTAIDPGTHRITRIPVGVKAPSWPRCVRGELWVTTSDSVLRVDPRSGAVDARIALGGTPVEAIAGPDGLVWVTDKERSVVTRIDPATNSVVDSFRAGPGAFAMARVGDSVWVTSFAGSDMHRFDS